MDELDPLFKETNLVVSISSVGLLNSTVRSEFLKMHLRSKEDAQLIRRTSKLSSDSDLIDRYSGSYHWQLHYLYQLLFHYEMRYKMTPSQYRYEEEARILTEVLALIDNLSSEVTTISKTLIKDELSYD